MVGSTIKGGRAGGVGHLGGVIEIGPGFFNQPKRFLETIMNNLTWMRAGVQIQKYIAQLAGASIAKNFAIERGTTRRWKGLAQSTRKIRAKQGFNPRHPILRRSGNLFTAATQGLVVNPGYSGNLTLTIEPAVFKASPYDKRGTTPAAYFMAHQMGSGWKTPQRDFFWIRRKDFKIIGDLMVATVLRQATAVAERRQSNEIYANFATRMDSLSIYEDQFRSQGFLPAAARFALAKIKGGIDM